MISITHWWGTGCRD